LPNISGSKVFIRKLIKAFKEHFLHVNSEEKIREIFAKDLRQIMQAMILCYNIDDPGELTIDETGVKRALIMDFSKMITFILIEESIYWSKNYEDRLSSFADGIA